MIEKTLVILMLALILASLFSALAFLLRGHGNDTRVAKALTLRISLSLLLFLVLMASYYLGMIPDQGF